MTVAALTATIEYLEDGATLAFAAPFRFLSVTDLVVERIDPDGNVQVLANGSEWSATGGTTDAGGTVTLVASVAGSTLRISRNTPRAQTSDYATGDRFPAETHEMALDRAMLIDQEQDDAIGDVEARALKAPPGETIGDLPPETTRAGAYLAFDAVGAPVGASGTGADLGLRADLAASTGARLIGTRQGLSVQAAIDALGLAGQCLIVPVIGQSLSIGRAPQITPGDAVPNNLYMPVGGPEWPTMTAPVPLSSSTRPVVPSNFASFVPYVPLAGLEGLAPGMGWQLAQAGYATVVTWASGEGGASLSQLLPGGSTVGGAGGPYFANLQSFLYHAVKWARARGLVPVIKPVFIQGHGDADLFVDGGLPGTETLTAAYLAGLVKLKTGINLACLMALGEPWNETLWLTPLLTGQAAVPYTLVGRKQVVAAQLLAAQGGVQGVRLLSPHSQFAATFGFGDLVHPLGQGYRYYGEVAGASLAAGDRTVPYMTGKTVISGTQVKISWSEAVEISALVGEATTAGVMAGLEAYTAGGVQLPLTAAAVTGTKEVTVTMANTATFSVMRNGLAQETVGGAALMPRTRVASVTPLATAQDGTVLGVFSIPQEL